QNCTICAREQHFETRPIVSGGTPASSTHGHEAGARQRPARAPDGARARGARAVASSGRSGRAGVQVRRLARGAQDGYRSPLVPGLKSNQDAERLAQEIAFASTRLAAMRAPSEIELWGQVADPVSDIEERTWLAFLIAYIGPDDSAQPFAAIQAARTPWSAGGQPHWEHVRPGPRGAYDPARAALTVAAYRVWAERAGSQGLAFAGEPGWTPERRFERVFERLALPGMTRDARFELLTLLGRAGVHQMRASMLALSGENEATWAAKRALGIGDPLLLERRAAELAGACEAPLDALDLALHNWGSGTRVGGGFPLDTPPDEGALARARDALGLGR
ncbi:MAG: hypothetical protein ACRDKL_04070, partial [Solirubrobacteraceae bacterium]